MYRKVIFSLTLLSLIVLSLIAWKVGVFMAIASLSFFPLVEKIATNTYFSGVICSIIAVIIVYHAIWSNQCIEVWFLLHFSYFQSDIHRKEYWPKLSEIMTLYGLGPYSKGREDMYHILEPYMDTAIRNAKKLNAVTQVRCAQVPAGR